VLIFAEGVLKRGEKNKALIAGKLLLTKRKVRTKKSNEKVKNENRPSNKSVLSHTK